MALDPNALSMTTDFCTRENSVLLYTTPDTLAEVLAPGYFDHPQVFSYRGVGEDSLGLRIDILTSAGRVRDVLSFAGLQPMLWGGVFRSIP